LVGVLQIYEIRGIYQVYQAKNESKRRFLTFQDDFLAKKIDIGEKLFDFLCIFADVRELLLRNGHSIDLDPLPEIQEAELSINQL
jgi:hypothetical protein